MGRTLAIAVLLFFGSWDVGAQSARAKALPKFMGREVTVVTPELDEDGFFPKGPASVCVEGLQRQCYTAPKSFGRAPTVTVVQLSKDMPALLFSAASVGGSGFAVHFALLRPGMGKDLEDLFLSGVEVSNESQHAFLIESTISAAPIFVTADFVWGPDESHHDEHRYMISAYVFKTRSVVGNPYYSYNLEDRYMTSRKYDSDTKTDILGSEKQEILARLRRVKIVSERKPQAPH